MANASSDFDVIIEVVESYREVIEISGAWNIYYIDSGSKISTYVHHQSPEALTWIIPHALDSFDLTITVYDETKLQHHPASIDFIDVNNININFTEPVAGRAILIKA